MRMTAVIMKMTIGEVSPVARCNNSTGTLTNSSELQARWPEFFLGETKGTKDVDDDDRNPKDSDPHVVWHCSCSIPILEDKTCNSQFKRENDHPLGKVSIAHTDKCDLIIYLENIVVTHSETPWRIDKANGVCVETTGDRVHDSHFTKSVHNHEHHDTNDREIDQDRSRTLVNMLVTWQDAGDFWSYLTPLTKAPPEPTKNPAPIEPPNQLC